MNLLLHNTLSGKKEVFEPIKPSTVKMYHCGPTVYNFPSIGNMRSYIFADILRRTFEYFRYFVTQVINITDVGHLVGDGDDGEDKVEKVAQERGETAKQIARFYEEAFYLDLANLNIKTEDTHFPKASEHIKEQIELIKILEEKGVVYQTSDGIYFDTKKFDGYGKLGNINLEGQEEGARIGTNSEKKSKTDFALWKFSGERERLQEWKSPWGTGFPGWHIECSAMSRKILGQPFDIHTGGIDHIPTHHNGEIAQSECAYGAPLSNYWLHNEFLKVDDEKMSKSLGNVYTLKNLKEKGVHPLSFRYWLLGGHYRSPMNFTWEAVRGAQNALESLIVKYTNMEENAGSDLHSSHKEDILQFEQAVKDDLNTPIALAIIQRATHKETIDRMDTILGLNIKNLAKDIAEVPEDVSVLQKERDQSRIEKNWTKSDKLREEIEQQGYILEDRSEVSNIRKTLSLLI